ncbi:MAG: hypothetical protein NZ580_00985 [Bacteroidia bacterium]|nr:hypothetical protein [Bacteroidia bacterium]
MREGGHPQLITIPHWGNRQTRVCVALAWRHTPPEKPTAEWLLRLAASEGVHLDKPVFAESLGVEVRTWCREEGAALILVVPRSQLIPAIERLYFWMQNLPLEDTLRWIQVQRAYLRSWQGFSLQQELQLRLRHSALRLPLPDLNRITAYAYRYLHPDSLILIVSSALSLKEKNAILRLPFLWTYFAPKGSPTFSLSTSSRLPPDSIEENLWAYPGYVALYISTPCAWDERLAFLQAFLTRWKTQAPPLSWQGSWENACQFFLQARLDGKSFLFLRNLTHLSPRDSSEVIAWHHAYTAKIKHLLTYPEEYVDFWLPVVLRGDSLSGRDTLLNWQWDFQARGLWLYNELLWTDTLPKPSEVKTNRLSQAPPSFTWRGKSTPPLSQWAVALQAYADNANEKPCELIGYYRKRQHQRKRLSYLHSLRKQLIQRYHVLPQQVRVVLRRTESAALEETILLQCYE